MRSSRLSVPFAVLFAFGCAPMVIDQAEEDDSTGAADEALIDGTPPRLPSCTSTLARAILESKDEKGRNVMSTLSKGTLPGQLMATERNRAASGALLTGPKIFPAMGDLIEGAESQVNFQTYVWENDTDPTNELLAGLKRLEKRRLATRPSGPPVRVRILVDASGLGFGSTVKAVPQTVGKLMAMNLDPRAISWDVGYYYHLAFGNLHVKSVVVDARAAIITGANPQAHHDYADPWFDAGFQLEGQIALSLAADFTDAWSRGQVWTCDGNEENPRKACSAPPKNEAIEWTELPALASACVPMFVVGRASNANPLQNGIDNPQDQAFLGAFRSARSTIRVMTPNLNDDAAKRGLIEAAKRGVRVELVLSKNFNDTSEKLPGQGGTNEKNVGLIYDELARAFPDPAERCARFDIRWYSSDGKTPIEGNGLYASHAKYMSVDDEAAIIGTANHDTQSWNNSREVNVLVDDVATTRSWDGQVFEPVWNRALQARPECAEAAPSDGP